VRNCLVVVAKLRVCQISRQMPLYKLKIHILLMISNLNTLPAPLYLRRVTIAVPNADILL
jgi:hypothetical protein